MRGWREPGPDAPEGSALGRFAGERVVIAGFRLAGQASAKVLLAEGAQVRVSESAPLEQIAPRVPPGLDVDLRAGGHQPEHLEGATLLVVSPGVPESAPVITWARRRGIPVWSELELGARLCRVPVIAVTGTNGKTTTVEMIAQTMRASGLSVRACGNVGYPFPVAAREAFDALVVEASSYQLRFQTSLRPKVSVLLNLAPDHLDWHRSFAAYRAAKARIFARQRKNQVHVGNRDDPEASRLSATAPCPVRWFGWGPPRAGDVGIVAGRVVTGGPHEADLGTLPPNASSSLLSDAAACAAASLAFGLPPQAIRSGLAAFEPLPHRGSVVAQVESVKFIDDSKATNPHAALSALEGLSGAVLIAGGLAKGVDLSPLASATPSLAGVVAIGESAPDVAAVFEGLVPVWRASSMEEAVRQAFMGARPVGTVVLAPACASQDMFRDYKERGDRFARAAGALGGPTIGPGRSLEPRQPDAMDVSSHPPGRLHA